MKTTKNLKQLNEQELLNIDGGGWKTKVVTKFIPGVGAVMTVVSAGNAVYQVGKGIKKGWSEN